MMMGIVASKARNGDAFHRGVNEVKVQSINRLLTMKVLTISIAMINHVRDDFRKGRSPTDHDRC